MNVYKKGAEAGHKGEKMPRSCIESSPFAP